MKLRILFRGLLGYIPGLLDYLKNRKERTGTVSARYCYSVWLRHLIHLHNVGLIQVPQTVAEFGPGASLGIGLAALLTGANSLFAFDVIHHTDIKKNEIILDELVLLFKTRAPIPNLNEFPKITPEISSHDFPSYILSDSLLEKMLSYERINEIKQALEKKSKSIKIDYVIPWNKNDLALIESIDLIFSQAVMEHVMNIEEAYEKMSSYLKKQGHFSHQIDYKAHETHKVWNGHWKYPNFLWNIILKGRSYPINRLPHSIHVKNIINSKFKILSEIPIISVDGVRKDQVNSPFSDYPESDFKISGALIIAIKK